MNILLADVQSMTTQSSESGAAAGLDDGKFSALMEQQLRQDETLANQVEYPQVVDIKELTPDFLSVSDSLPTAAEGIEAEFSWPEFLINQSFDVENKPIETDLPVDSIEQQATELSEELLEQPVSSVVAELGEVLPVGGNALPQTNIETAEITSESIMAVVPQVTGLQRELSRQGQIAGPPLNNNLVDVEAVESKTTISSVAKLTDSISMPLATDAAKLLQGDKIIDPAKQAPTIDTQAFNQVVNEALDHQTNVRVLASNTTASIAMPIVTSSALPADLETLTLTQTRDTTAWGNGIGERVGYMINQKMNTATIRLDPPMLGRLEVHIQVNQDVTNVTINTQHAQTRDLIDSASFRLKDFLQENGYQNVNVDVSHQQQQTASQQQDQSQTEATDNATDSSASHLSDQSDDQQDDRYFSSSSLVDYFA